MVSMVYVYVNLPTSDVMPSHHAIRLARRLEQATPTDLRLRRVDSIPALGHSVAQGLWTGLQPGHFAEDRR